MKGSDFTKISSNIRNFEVCNQPLFSFTFLKLSSDIKFYTLGRNIFWLFWYENYLADSLQFPLYWDQNVYPYAIYN